ncbi:hypothetical protein FM037_26275 [Shewanella psychropiezotolerans]|uniref:Uncharacterized protein n=1 Tax=Shewanella psychropiezotolerans TaxID=2593655 RepID=A0ABX5X442_9GAMM|nr:hypothetical protein [Shewanella sp. YLB-07]QDO86124.1 hypothetical protein FM037_26275 [Shewanella psychropiezotolerans]
MCYTIPYKYLVSSEALSFFNSRRIDEEMVFPFKSMQHRSGNTKSLTQCGFQSPLCYVECSRYRITISFKHSPCLQCFELPLNNQILTRNGIKYRGKQPQTWKASCSGI